MEPIPRKIVYIEEQFVEQALPADLQQELLRLIRAGATVLYIKHLDEDWSDFTVRNPPKHTVYQRFIEEIEAMVIKTDMPAAAIVGDLTRAVKRAQMTFDGELRPVAERER